ncbi:MAG: hypothetical protein NVSMB14_10480 [Isosphaeraceae bacterium]
MLDVIVKLPEPASLALLATGFAFLSCGKIRKRLSSARIA